MATLLEEPIAALRSASLIDIAPSPAEHAPWPGNPPPSIPLSPRPPNQPEPQVTDPPETARPIQNSNTWWNGAMIVPLAISTTAFVAWIFLMVTVVAADGTASQIIGITLIPLVAHVVSLYLASRSSASRETIGA